MTSITAAAATPTRKVKLAMYNPQDTCVGQVGHHQALLELLQIVP